MRVCLNYYGQNRDASRTKSVYDNTIRFDQYPGLTYDILYTTWKDENIEGFFPNAFIRQVEQPNLEDYKDFIQNYKMDSSNAFKSMEHYLLGLYIKKKSYETIEEYEKNNNITFDFIISLRTDVIIYRKHLCIFYKTIYNNLNNIIYVPNDPRFGSSSISALPDSLYIGNKEVMKKVLSQIDILKYCVIPGTREFHPETSFFLSIIYHSIVIGEIDITAFPKILMSEE